MRIPINIKEGEINKEQDQETIIGIDLGTTNSLVAYIRDGDAVAVKDKDGKNTLVPSIIHFSDKSDDTHIIVGNEAKEQLAVKPERTIYSVKRLMGKSYEDLLQKGFELNYEVIDDKNDDNKLVKVEIDEKYYTPIELSANILRELKLRVEADLNQQVSKAVITVPAYFNDSQRQATRDAGKLAGLDVLRIVNEPTAASLAYGIGLDLDEEKTIAVYDLGGGTFDISILHLHQGIFEVLSTHGDTFLGGDDFDQAIIAHWTAGDSKKLSKEEFGGLRLLAEEAKRALSTEEKFEKEIDGKKFEITKETFNSLVEPIVQRTIESCKQSVADADLNIEDIDSVVLVGGSTRVPIVKEAVSTFFNKEPFDDLNPDEVVALGAAIQADILAGNRKDILLLDVTPLSLGIETVGGLMDIIIPRNSKVPTRVGRNYTTSVDGQKNLKIAVFQGERDLVQDNRKIGEFVLSDIPPMPAGIPKIEIQFVLDADGILTVKAMEHRSGKETQIQIRSTYGISEEEMAEMLLDSIQNAAADMKKRALLEATNEANNITLSTDKFIKENRAYLTTDQINQLTALNAALKTEVNNQDKDAIESAMKKLNDYAAPLAQKMLDINISKALKEKKIAE